MRFNTTLGGPLAGLTLMARHTSPYAPLPSLVWGVYCSSRVEGSTEGHLAPIYGPDSHRAGLTQVSGAVSSSGAIAPLSATRPLCCGGSASTSMGLGSA